jgi:hypothetical protein
MVSPTILFGSHVVLRRLFLFLGSTTILFLTHEFIKPRLPVYTIQINLFPLVHFVKSPVTHHWQTILSTNIQFYNENYLHLSIHAMTFDAYIERYETFDKEDDEDGNHSVASATSSSSLLHIATITDQNQHSSNNHKNALWSIPGRTNFTINHCPLYMSFFEASSSTATTVTNASTMTYVKSILRVTYKLISFTIRKLWHNNGSLSTTFTIPTTGVAHIRASMLQNNKSNTTLAAAMPFTVGMICNNEISLLHLQIIGIQCQQYVMIPGWNEPISIVAAQLRNYAVTKLMILNTTTGSVIS